MIFSMYIPSKIGEKSSFKLKREDESNAIKINYPPTGAYIPINAI